MTNALAVRGEVRWQGEHRAADEFTVHETRPAVLADDAGAHWAILRIFRFGIFLGETVDGPFASLSEAREAAQAMQRDFIAPDANAEHVS